LRLFTCQACQQVLYFENTSCEKCSHRLGFLTRAATLTAVEPEGDSWKALAAPAELFRFCANAQYDACNWLIDAHTPDTLCLSCRHNRTIPDLSIESNVLSWRRIQRAKHRLFYSLLRLRLPSPRPDTRKARRGSRDRSRCQAPSIRS
jgi:hypothetical protein